MEKFKVIISRSSRCSSNLYNNSIILSNSRFSRQKEKFRMKRQVAPRKSFLRIRLKHWSKMIK